MKNYIVTVNGVQYSVSVEETDKVESNEVVKQIESPKPAVAAAKPSVSSNSKVSVNAPMPGTILKINVTKGQSVKKGDTLLILEAMKMENEISAPEDGTVDVVAVSKGASVKTGDLLVGLN